MNIKVSTVLCAESIHTPLTLWYSYMFYKRQKYFYQWDQNKWKYLYLILLFKHVSSNEKHGGDSFILWGYFSSAGIGNIVDDKRKTAQYKATLELYKTSKTGYTFKQNNNPQLKAKCTMERF